MQTSESTSSRWFGKLGFQARRWRGSRFPDRAQDLQVVRVVHDAQNVPEGIYHGSGDEPGLPAAGGPRSSICFAHRGLSTLCVEVDVNDRGTFLFAEHDERDSLSRPYGEGYGLVEEVVVVRDFLLHVVRERFYRHFFTSSRPRDAQVALRKGHPH